MIYDILENLPVDSHPGDDNGGSWLWGRHGEGSFICYGCASPYDDAAAGA